MGIIVFLLIGALAGYLGSRLMGGAGNGLLLNIVIGIVGGCLGGALLGDLFSFLPSIGSISLGGIVTATLGSALLIWIISLIKK